jgi:hypothetical protein
LNSFEFDGKNVIADKKQRLFPERWLLMTPITAGTFLGLAILLDPSPSHVEALVRQLGSSEFAKREAASKTLEAIGQPTINALRRAAKGDEDAEIHRRASRLVLVLEDRAIEKEARAIRDSNLTSKDKGRKLKALIKVGMTSEQVTRLLGIPAVVGGIYNLVSIYPNQIIISYGQDGGVASVEGPDDDSVRKRRRAKTGR